MCACVCGGGHIVVFVPLGVIVFWMRALLVLSTGPCQGGCSAQPRATSAKALIRSLDVLNIVLLEESNLCKEEQCRRLLLLLLLLPAVQNRNRTQRPPQDRHLN